MFLAQSLRRLKVKLNLVYLTETLVACTQSLNLTTKGSGNCGCLTHAAGELKRHGLIDFQIDLDSKCIQ